MAIEKTVDGFPWHIFDKPIKKKKESDKKTSGNGNGDWHDAPWQDWPEDQPYELNNKKGLAGIIRLAMNESELREFYGSRLVPLGFSENEILSMPMDELEEIFNGVMGI
tara:strand:- start:2 stop:328 length:327 start_codon:yes stop_codon:yes gene_type:complete